MKIWKTLMPVATLGATAACVVPMASCGESAIVKTSELTFKPTIADAKEYNTASDALKAYISKDNVTNIANDVAYTIVTKVMEPYKKSAEAEMNNVQFNFNVAINDITVGDAKEITISETKVNGYLMSGKATYSYTVSGDVKEPGEYISSITSTETETATITFKNFFVYIMQTGSTTEGQKWAADIAGYKTASDSFEFELDLTNKTSGSVKYKDGKTYSKSVTTPYYEYHSAKNGQEYFSSKIFNSWLCYTFDKATVKAA